MTTSQQLHTDRYSKLLHTLKRNGSTLSHYNQDEINMLLHEIKIHDQNTKELHSTIQSANTTKQASYQAKILCLERLKRILLAYHVTRTNIIQSICKEVSIFPQHIKSRLSASEITFMESFMSLIRRRYAAVYPSLDLFSSLALPKDLLIEIRVVRDCGKVYTRSGALLRLHCGEQLYVLRTDVEDFIRLGYVIHLTDDY